MPDSVPELVARHRLVPHPEGGYFREIYRSSSMVTHPTVGEVRAASTAILFLLTPSSFSAFHRLRSDEAWHFYGGDPIRLVLLSPDGLRELVLGPDNPVAVAPAGTWQAASCVGSQYSFCGCTVAPGFEFSDFEMGSRAQLIEEFPSRRDVIDEFTRD